MNILSAVTYFISFWVIYPKFCMQRFFCTSVYDRWALLWKHKYFIFEFRAYIEMFIWIRSDTYPFNQSLMHVDEDRPKIKFLKYFTHMVTSMRQFADTLHQLQGQGHSMRSKFTYTQNMCLLHISWIPGLIWNYIYTWLHLILKACRVKIMFAPLQGQGHIWRSKVGCADFECTQWKVLEASSPKSVEPDQTATVYSAALLPEDSMYLISIVLPSHL